MENYNADEERQERNAMPVIQQRELTKRQFAGVNMVYSHLAVMNFNDAIELKNLEQLRLIFEKCSNFLTEEEQIYLAQIVECFVNASFILNTRDEFFKDGFRNEFERLYNKFNCLN